MSMSDFEKIGMGAAAHQQKLSELGLTSRDLMLMAYRHETPPILPNIFVDGAILLNGGDVERYGGRDSGYDGWGCEWTFVPEQNAPIPTPGKYVMEDITQWRELVHFPDLDSYDWATISDRDIHCDGAHFMSTMEYKRLPDGKAFNDGGKCAILILGAGMFERMHALMGFENALLALVEEPEECYEFFSAVADWKIKFFRKLNEYYPIDVINAHDDYGSQDRLFMSLDTWRKLLKPNLKKMVDAVHEMGIVFQHHSCGYVEPLIPEFIEIGIDATDTLQAACNPNLKELKAKYGSQITFVGGFNNTNVFDKMGVTPEECKAEYVRVINDLAPGGSYIAFTGAQTSTCVIPCLAQHYDMCLDVYGKSESVAP